MPKRIYKFEVREDGKTHIQRGAQILKAEVQGDGIYLWALVDPTRPLEKHYFNIFGTGQELPPDIEEHRYIDTVFQGPFVWHIFQKGGV